MAFKRTPQTDQLVRSLLTLGSAEEGYQLLEDLCTIREIYSIAQRLEAARVLSLGDSYQQTQERTGASSATISRVKRCLDYGEGGYRLVLDRLEEEEKE